MGFYIKCFSRTQLTQEERQSRSKQVLLSQYPDSSIRNVVLEIVLLVFGSVYIKLFWYVND